MYLTTDPDEFIKENYGDVRAILITKTYKHGDDLDDLQQEWWLYMLRHDLLGKYKYLSGEFTSYIYACIIFFCNNHWRVHDRKYQPERLYNHDDLTGPGPGPDQWDASLKDFESYIGLMGPGPARDTVFALYNHRKAKAAGFDPGPWPRARNLSRDLAVYNHYIDMYLQGRPPRPFKCLQIRTPDGAYTYCVGEIKDVPSRRT
jgi:hypothetical protein